LEGYYDFRIRGTYVSRLRGRVRHNCRIEVTFGTPSTCTDTVNNSVAEPIRIALGQLLHKERGVDGHVGVRANNIKELRATVFSALKMVA